MEFKNNILKSLPADELSRAMNVAEFVHIDIRDVAIEVDKPIEFVDFVEAGLHSIVALVDGEEIEVATVGREGMIGIPLVLGSTTTINRVFCQVPGSAWRIQAPDFLKLLQTCPTMTLFCQRYTFSILEQSGQNSACNRLHSIEERCAKWLLLTHDRMDGDEFMLTQEFLAQMLGVRRASVNLAAGTLQNAGFINYSRGKIRVLDRAGLESVTCECYPIIRKSLNTLSQ